MWPDESGNRSAGSLLLLSTLVACPLAAQTPVDRIPLAPPVARLSYAFSHVAGVAERTGRRLVVADSKDHILYVADLETGRTAQLGQKGPGPDEYETAFGLVPGRADTVYLYDPRKRHLLRIAPDDRIAGSLSIPVGAIRGGLSLPRGSDGQGRFYWSRPVIADEPGLGVKRRQTLALVRWTPGSESVEPVGQVSDHDPGMHRHRFHPFAQRDAWVVAPDGNLGVLVASEYRLRWLQDGRMVSEGPRVPFEPVPVTGADRRAFRLERAGNQPRAVMRGERNVEAPPAARIRTMELAYPDEMFPRHKPPFEPDGAWLTPGGNLMIARSRSAGDSVPVVDVLDGAGNLRRSYRLPENTRLVAVGRLGLYLARVDEDGLEYVQVHAWPNGVR